MEGELYHQTDGSVGTYSFSQIDSESPWEIYKETGLTFAQVILGLKEGKRFRRREWINQSYHISNELGMGILNMNGHSPIFDILDFEGKDWEEVK